MNDCACVTTRANATCARSENLCKYPSRMREKSARKPQSSRKTVCGRNTLCRGFPAHTPLPNYLRCIIGSAEALPILCVRYNRWERERERERERDGSSETEVVRRKWRHHCRAKTGDKFALSHAKNSHLSFPPSHFPSLPSRRGHQRWKWRHHCRAKIGDKFALSLAKNSHLSFPPSHFPSLPSRTGHLYETSKNSIKLIPKTIGNRKRDCALGCAGVKNWRKSIVEHKSSPGEADMGFDDLCSTIDFSSVF